MPAHEYYRACEGRWTGRFSLRVTGFAALRAARGWLDAVGFWLLAALPGLRMATTVRVESETAVRHTTALRWGPLTLMRGTEALRLDGPRLALRGTGRTAHGQSFAVSGSGTVDAASRNAEYTLTWMGMPVRQTGARTGDGVTLCQWGPGFESRVGLRRLSAP